MKISEETRIDPEPVAKLSQKIDDLRCALQIALFLILFISVIQILQILNVPSYLLSSMIFYIVIVLVLFLSAAICILRTEDNEKTATTSTQI